MTWKQGVALSLLWTFSSRILCLWCQRLLAHFLNHSLDSLPCFGCLTLERRVLTTLDFMTWWYHERRGIILKDFATSHSHSNCTRVRRLKIGKNVHMPICFIGVSFSGRVECNYEMSREHPRAAPPNVSDSSCCFEQLIYEFHPGQSVRRRPKQTKKHSSTISILTTTA